jgi:hypothetical protein
VRHGCFASAVALAVTVVAPLAAGQAPGAPTSIGGCPAEPLAFHKCALEKAKTFNPPRTPSGKPNLQGYWRSRLAPAFSAEGVSADDPLTKLAVMPWEVGAAMVVDPADRKIPYQPWAAAIGRRGVNFQKYIDPRTACGTGGVPRLALQDPSQILQPADDTLVVWNFEDHHVSRIIPMDGRPRVPSNMKFWNGQSRGRWEGNTLVIDVTNLNGYTWIDDSGNFYTDAAHIVERLTMIAPDTIHYQVTIEDPTAYTRPFTMVWAQVRITDPEFVIYEESCWEGERDLPRMRELGMIEYYGKPWRARPR